MESKGFGAYEDRTYLHDMSLAVRDVVFLLGLITVLTVALYVFTQLGFITHFGPQFGTPYQRVGP